MKINKTIKNKLAKRVYDLVSECGDRSNKICNEYIGSLDCWDELQVFLTVLKSELPFVYDNLEPKYESGVCYYYVININSMIDLTKYSTTLECYDLLDGLSKVQIKNLKKLINSAGITIAIPICGINIY